MGVREGEGSEGRGGRRKKGEGTGNGTCMVVTLCTCVYMCTNVTLQSENKAAYMFTVEFIRKNSSYLEPFIQLVSKCNV